MLSAGNQLDCFRDAPEKQLQAWRDALEIAKMSVGFPPKTYARRVAYYETEVRRWEEVVGEAGT